MKLIQKGPKGFGVRKAELTVAKATSNKDIIIEHEGQEISAAEFIEKRMLLNKDEIVNLVGHNYLTNVVDLVWTTDITQFGKTLYMLMFIDIASRNIVGYKLQTKEFTTKDVIECFLLSAAERNKTPYIVHSDQGGVYLNEMWRETLVALNVNPSYNLVEEGKTKKHFNQVSERLNRTIKSNVMKILQTEYGIEDSKTNKSSKANWDVRIRKATNRKPEEFQGIVERAVTMYYNTGHANLENMTPVNTDLSLSVAEHANRLKSSKTLLFNDNEKKAIEVRKERAELSERFAVNTLAARKEFSDLDLPPLSVLHIDNVEDLNLHTLISEYYKDLKNEVNIVKQQNYLLHREVSSNREAIDSNREAINNSTETILSGTKEVVQEVGLSSETNQAKIERILEILVEKERQENLIAERRRRRKAAQKQPEREYITLEEFEEILQSSEDLFRYNKYVISRCIIAFLLMYTTGLRISNLLLFKVHNINELLDHGRTKVNIIKKGTQNKQIIIGIPGKQLLKAYIKEINVICEGKTEEDYVFTSKNILDKPLHRVTFNKNLNAILNHVSVKIKKNLLSHSFRATYVTDMLKEQSIEEVKDLIGHQSILTTDRYRRAKTSNADLTKVINGVQSARLKQFKLKKIGREKSGE